MKVRKEEVYSICDLFGYRHQKEDFCVAFGFWRRVSGHQARINDLRLKAQNVESQHGHDIKCSHSTNTY